jgi:capsular exopolysaccharide synthesis family protein
MIGRVILDPNPSDTEFGISQQLARAYVDLVSREPVQEAVRQTLGLDKLPKNSAKPVFGSPLLEISVTDTDPIRAQVVANELARQLILQSPTNPQQDDRQRQEFIDTQLNETANRIITTQDEINALQEELGDLTSAVDIAQTQEQIKALETKLTALQSIYANLISRTQEGSLNTLSVFEQASAPTTPVGPNKVLIIIVATIAGFAISLAAVYVLDYLDDALRSPEDIHRQLDLPVVGFISAMAKGKYHGDYVAKHPRSSIAESFRALRTDLEFAAVDHPLKTILVTSPGVAAGKTSIAINLAVVIAQAGKKVYLLDADLRKPSVHRSLGLPNRQGLSDAFRREKDIRDLAQFWQDGNIHVITSGPLPPNPSELLSSQKMDQILQTIEREVDVLIIDGPPFLVTDAAILSAKSEGVLLVVRYGHTRKGEAASAVKQLQRTGARILGIVLNQIPQSGQEKYGIYRYYAGYYAERSDDEDFTPQNGKVRLLRLFSKESKKPVEEE